MTRVFDASAVLAALLDDGPDGRWCDHQMQPDGMAAPELMPFEVANIIRRTEARGAIDATTAEQAMTDLGELRISLVPFAVMAGRVWELRTNLTVYDASHVALAEAVGGPVVTLDRRLAKAPGLRCEVLVGPGS